MIVRWWLELPNKFPNVNVDIFMPMPNHFHGNIFISDGGDADRRGRPTCRPWFGRGDNGGEHGGSPQPTIAQPIGSPQRTDSPPTNKFIPTNRFAATTTKRTVIANDPMVQNHDHQRIHSRRQTIGLETVQRQSLAAQLLRTHHSQRNRWTGSPVTSNPTRRAGRMTRKPIP